MGGAVVIGYEDEFCFGLCGMGFEVAAYQVAIPLPVVFADSGSVDADEATAVADIILQGFFFFGAEDRSGRAEKNERGIFFQRLLAKPGGVSGGVDRATHLHSQFGNSRAASRGAGMIKDVGPVHD